MIGLLISGAKMFKKHWRNGWYDWSINLCRQNIQKTKEERLCIVTVAKTTYKR